MMASLFEVGAWSVGLSVGLSVGYGVQNLSETKNALPHGAVRNLRWSVLRPRQHGSSLRSAMVPWVALVHCMLALSDWCQISHGIMPVWHRLQRVGPSFKLITLMKVMFIKIITVANVRFNGNSVVGMRDHILDTIFSSTPYNIYNASTD